MYCSKQTVNMCLFDKLLALTITVFWVNLIYAFTCNIITIFYLHASYTYDGVTSLIFFFFFPIYLMGNQPSCEILSHLNCLWGI